MASFNQFSPLIWRSYFSFFALLIVHHSSAGRSCKDHISEHGFALIQHVYKSFAADRLATCYIACNIEPTCQSFNYNLADKTCEFNNDTKYYSAKNFVEKATSVYADNPDSETPWRKLNTAPVCFGAKDDQFGKFVVDVGGSVNAVKLVHVSGLVSCKSYHFSNWGCNVGENIATVLTTSSNIILLPESQKDWYSLPGFNSGSKEIVFSDLKNPLILSSGRELRIWYSEDLINMSESDNGGVTCADVYAKYM